jgi:hypothetical protein
MRAELSITQRTDVVRALRGLTEADEVRWAAAGEPGSFRAVRGRAVATIERTDVGNGVRLRFEAPDSDAGAVVIEQPEPAADDAKELKILYTNLGELWRRAEKLVAVPNAAELFLRGEA